MNPPTPVPGSRWRLKVDSEGAPWVVIRIFNDRVELAVVEGGPMRMSVPADWFEECCAPVVQA